MLDRGGVDLINFDGGFRQSAIDIAPALIAWLAIVREGVGVRKSR
jgi:hypothetical protein